MSTTNTLSSQEKKDRLKSAVITLLVSLLVLLVIYFYTFTRETPKQEVVSTMLINFGETTKGTGIEESTPEVEAKPLPKPIVPPKQEPKKEIVTPKKEKIITGKNAKISVPKVEKIENKTPKKNLTKKEVAKPNPQKATSSSQKSKMSPSNATNENQSKTAIHNLIKGRGRRNNTSQGSNNNTGNAGDPLGGNSHGESRIGTDRKLISFIPGTMGRGGVQPAHSCTASGSISIAYVVDKAGNVVSARRSGGVSDPCVVSTTVAWVKKYVKAERASTSSTGVYKIVF